MRDSAAEIEKLLTVVHRETMFDRNFLNGLLDHKNATIAWVRERQNEDVAALEVALEATVAQIQATIAHLQRVFDDMTDNLMKEVELLEKHMASYEKGLPKEEPPDAT